MSGFGRKQLTEESDRTCVEATHGGLPNAPARVLVDGIKHADYVEATLKSARQCALNERVEIGETFVYTLMSIPQGVGDLYEIYFGLRVQAEKYGLMVHVTNDRSIHFCRVS